MDACAGVHHSGRIERNHKMHAALVQTAVREQALKLAPVRRLRALACLVKAFQNIVPLAATSIPRTAPGLDPSLFRVLADGIAPEPGIRAFHASAGWPSISRQRPSGLARIAFARDRVDVGSLATDARRWPPAAGSAGWPHALLSQSPALRRHEPADASPGRGRRGSRR